MKVTCLYLVLNYSTSKGVSKFVIGEFYVGIDIAEILGLNTSSWIQDLILKSVSHFFEDPFLFLTKAREFEFVFNPTWAHRLNR